MLYGALDESGHSLTSRTTCTPILRRVLSSVGLESGGSRNGYRKSSGPYRYAGCAGRFSWSSLCPSDWRHADGEAGLMLQPSNLFIELLVDFRIPDFEIVQVPINLRQVFAVCHYVFSLFDSSGFPQLGQIP